MERAYASDHDAAHRREGYIHRRTLYVPGDPALVLFESGATQFVYDQADVGYAVQLDDENKDAHWRGCLRFDVTGLDWPTVDLLTLRLVSKASYIYHPYLNTEPSLAVFAAADDTGDHWSLHLPDSLDFSTAAMQRVEDQAFPWASWAGAGHENPNMLAFSPAGLARLSALANGRAWLYLMLVLDQLEVDTGVRVTLYNGNAKDDQVPLLTATIRPMPREAIYERFVNQWGGRTSFCFDNEAFRPELGSSWVRLALRHHLTEQETIGKVGDRSFARRGMVHAQVFVPIDTGEAAALELAKGIQEIFEGTRFEGIAAGKATAHRVGAYGLWYQVNVDVPVEYVERR